jgi:peptide chain release factor 3
MQAEYGVALKLTPLPYQLARWPREGFDAEAFRYSESVKIVEDRDHRPVLLFRTNWNLDMTKQKNPDLVLAETGDAVLDAEPDAEA